MGVAEKCPNTGLDKLTESLRAQPSITGYMRHLLTSSWVLACLASYCLTSLELTFAANAPYQTLAQMLVCILSHGRSARTFACGNADLSLNFVKLLDLLGKEDLPWSQKTVIGDLLHWNDLEPLGHLSALQEEEALR